MKKFLLSTVGLVALGMAAPASAAAPGGSLASPWMMTTCASWLSTKRGMRWSRRR